MKQKQELGIEKVHFRPKEPGETTIPSYLVARRSRDLRLAADQETTQEWWEAERRGDPTHAAAREAWLAGVPLLGDLPEANELAKRLLRDEIIPAVAADDATHVALAAAHQMDFLLTWNCKHINNHNIRTRIQRACEAVGLVCPDICTPAEMMKL